MASARALRRCTGASLFLSFHAANRVRVYGSPPAIAAVDEIQGGFARLNAARTPEEQDDAFEQIRTGHDLLVVAAGEDVGPLPHRARQDLAYQGCVPSID